MKIVKIEYVHRLKKPQISRFKTFDKPSGHIIE